MKKQTLVIILIAVFIVSLVALVGCHECQFGQWTTVVEPTCTQVGQEQRVCVCGSSEVRDVPATGHNYQAEITEPTCLESGYTKHTCSSCGDSYVDEHVDALGHDEIGHEAQQPSCTESGWNYYVTCSRCDYSTFEEIPKLAHTEGEWEQDRAPTCTSSGSMHLPCAVCGTTLMTESIPPTDHDYNLTIVDPTCRLQGYTLHVCNGCNASFKSNYVPSLGGHDYKEDGYCINCGLHESEDNGYWVDDTRNYTYNMYGTIPSSWDPQKYMSSSSDYVLDYTTDTLYKFDYNEDGTGFVIVPSMASGMPLDVTAQYAGQYGIGFDETANKAYKIFLKDNLRFDNGDLITAETFVESMKILLNSLDENYYAISNNYFIAGVQMYANKGKVLLYDNSATEAYTEADLVKDANGVYKTPEGYDVYITIRDNLKWLGGNALIDYVSAYGERYFGMEAFHALAAMADGNGRIAVTDETLDLLEGVTTAVPDWNETRADVVNYLVYIVDYSAMEYEETVGFFATDDNALVVVLKDATENNFYLHNQLCTNFALVHPEKYRECIDTTSGYGTTVNNYVGYGPYKLTKYIPDTRIELTRNPYWHGYYEAEMYGQYQTNKIVCTEITENFISLDMFLKGELENYILHVDDMADYIDSDHLYYTNSETTWLVAMNPDYDNLQEIQSYTVPVTFGNAVVKTVLDIAEFRQALNFAIDRNAFNLEVSPTSSVATALISNMIVANIESGMAYRATDEAKDVILEYWGLADQWGPGKKYQTRDDALASISGFDPERAKELFEIAYNKAVERGDITANMIASGKWEVQLCIGLPYGGNFYRKGSEFLQKCWTEAVKGTHFEGHVTFINRDDLGSTTFGECLRNGSVDLLFGIGFNGFSLNPYSTMDCFTGDLQFDTFTDKKKIDLDVEINGQTLRASLYDWTSVCLLGNYIECAVIGENGQPTGETVQMRAGINDDQEIRTHILAKVEAKILSLSNVFPLLMEAQANLKSMRIVYKTEEYVPFMDHGGIAYYTYTMDDYEWAIYVLEQGGTLNYK